MYKGRQILRIGVNLAIGAALIGQLACAGDISESTGLIDLNQTSALRELFQENSEKVRLVTILSPN